MEGIEGKEDGKKPVYFISFWGLNSP